MLFVIIARDIENSSELRKKYRPEHLNVLEKLKGQSILKMAGPFTDGTGSLIILDVDSEEDAKKIIEMDTFYLNGVYKEYEIKPYKQVF